MDRTAATMTPGQRAELLVGEIIDHPMGRNVKVMFEIAKRHLAEALLAQREQDAAIADKIVALIALRRSTGAYRALTATKALSALLDEIAAIRGKAP